MAVERIKQTYFGFKKEVQNLSQGAEVTIRDSRIWGKTKLLVIANDGVIQSNAFDVAVTAFFAFVDGERHPSLEATPLIIGEDINKIDNQWKLKDKLKGTRTRVRYRPDSE